MIQGSRTWGSRAACPLGRSAERGQIDPQGGMSTQGENRVQMLLLMIIILVTIVLVSLIAIDQLQRRRLRQRHGSRR